MQAVAVLGTHSRENLGCSLLGQLCVVASISQLGLNPLNFFIAYCFYKIDVVLKGNGSGTAKDGG